MPDWETGSDPHTPGETPRLHPTAENYDMEIDRPIGTRSFTYGAKTLAASLVALVLSAANHGDTMPAFWTLVSAGLLGIMFSFIERRTTLGAETVNQRRVNVDVLLTALLAATINLIVYVAQR